MERTDSIGRNIKSVYSRLEDAARRGGRNATDIRLIAVGKTRPIEDLLAVLAAGVNDLGENRAQELKVKMAALPETVHWHFVGTLQKNKVKDVVGAVDLIHSVDSLELGQAIGERARRLGLVQSVLVQVNVSEESTKHGVSLKNLEKLVAEIDKLRHINIEGLMTIAPLVDDAGRAAPVFDRLREAFDGLSKRYRLTWLSMGMSDDFEVAVEAGSNMVRVGRAIFAPEFKEV